MLDAIESDDTRRRARRIAVLRGDPRRSEIAGDVLEEMLDDPEHGDWARQALTRIRKSEN